MPTQGIKKKTIGLLAFAMNFSFLLYSSEEFLLPTSPFLDEQLSSFDKKTSSDGVWQEELDDFRPYYNASLWGTPLQSQELPGSTTSCRESKTRSREAVKRIATYRKSPGYRQANNIQCRRTRLAAYLLHQSNQWPDLHLLAQERGRYCKLSASRELPPDARAAVEQFNTFFDAFNELKADLQKKGHLQFLLKKPEVHQFFTLVNSALCNKTFLDKEALSQFREKIVAEVKERKPKKRKKRRENSEKNTVT